MSIKDSKSIMAKKEFEKLPPSQQSAVLSYLEITKPEYSTLDIMNACAQVNEIAFYEYDFQGVEECLNMDPIEKYGYTKATENLLFEKFDDVDSNLIHHFNFREYGLADERAGFISICNNGYINLTETHVDLKKYTWNELKVKNESQIKKNLKDRVASANEVIANTKTTTPSKDIKKTVDKEY